MTRYTGIAGLFLAATGCNTSATVPEQAIVAFIQYGSVQPPEVALPVTIRAGVAFDVVVRPKLDCGSDAIPAQVSVSGNVAIVTARAVIPRHERGEVFTCEGRILNKSIGSVMFTSPGPATVQVHGRDKTDGRNVTVVYPVTVLAAQGIPAVYP